MCRVVVAWQILCARHKNRSKDPRTRMGRLKIPSTSAPPDPHSTAAYHIHMRAILQLLAAYGYTAASSTRILILLSFLSTHDNVF